MRTQQAVLLFIPLLLLGALSLTWCQSGDSERHRRDAGGVVDEGPEKIEEDAGQTPPSADASVSKSSASQPDGALEAGHDAEAAKTAQTELDAGAPPERDAAPTPVGQSPQAKGDSVSKTPPEPPEPPELPTQEEEAPEEPRPSLDPETNELTSLLQKVYRDVQSFEADFEQTYRNRLLDKTRESRGHVWLRPPSKMRWEYAPPSKNLIVADGRTLFVFEPEPNQVVKMPVGGSELPSVMAFLTGGRSLTEDYHAQEVHRDKLSPRGEAGLELRPKVPSSVVSRVVLVISRQTGKVQRTVLVEPEGNTNTFVWSKVKTNVTIPDRQFTFTPPPGARVVQR